MRSNQYSLGAALRVCQQCEATSPARQWRLLDRVTIDRSRPGQEILARMDGIPATDSRGRIAHVRGIYIHAQADVTLAAANDAITAYQMRSIWPSTFLRDFTGWTFFADVDGRTFLDDQYYRWGSHIQWPAFQSGVQAVSLQGNSIPSSVIDGDAGIATDTGLGDIVRDISIYIPFTNPGKHPLRGLIPLAALQRVSNNALTIRMGTQFRSAPAGVTFNGPQVTDEIDGVVREGFDIWVDVVYLSALIIDAPWMLDEYTLTDLTGTFLNPERVSEYVWIRFFPEDDLNGPPPGVGQQLVQALDGITIDVAGFNLKSGQRIDDAVFDMFLDEASRWSSSIPRSNAAQSLPLATQATGPLTLSLLPYRARSQAAAGPVSYRFETRSNIVTFNRYVHRTVVCHTAERGALMQARLECGPCAIEGTTYDGKACKGINSYEPVIAVPRPQARRMMRRAAKGLM